MTSLTKIGKRLDNIVRYVLDNHPQDKWILSNIVPLFLEAIKSSTSIQEEQLIIVQLNKLLDNFEFRYNQIFEYKNKQAQQINQNLTNLIEKIKKDFNIQEEKVKRDRCLRIADRKFDKPSAYKSGAVVRCRAGKIWKDVKETSDPQSGKAAPYGSGYAKVEEYNDMGPSTPKTYIVKNDGTYKEVPIKLLSKIPNLTYDMGGGETNYYHEKNIVIVDNIPIEEFIEDPGDIKDEKIYVEYNLNQPYSFPKADKIIASQLVYHLDDVKSFAKTVANSLKGGGVIEFFSDIMSKEDKIFLEYLSSEFGFGIPSTLSKYKNSTIKITTNKYIPLTEYYIYEVTNDVGNISKISTTKKGSWWKYVKVEGNLNFKPIEGLNPEHFNQLGLEPNEALKKQLEQFSEILGYNIINIKKIDQITEFKNISNWFTIKETSDPQSGKAAPYGSGYAVVKEELLREKVKETLRTWFKRKGAPGKTGGWVDCNAPIRKDGKITGYKPCGRQKGEKRSYPACRPTPAGCKAKGKGTKWGKTK
jgi:hypothetical protein